MTTLTLDTTGPSPNPLTVPTGDRSLTIANNLGAEVVLTIDPAGFLNPSDSGDPSHVTVVIGADGWSGTVGATGGTYEYVEPNSTKKSTRNGTINVG